MKQNVTAKGAGILVLLSDLASAFHESNGEFQRAAILPLLRKGLMSTTLALAFMFGDPAHHVLNAPSACAHAAPIEMTFANGPVRLDDPLRSFPGLDLRHPQYLGSGGGGAVFAYDRAETTAARSPSTGRSTGSGPTSGRARDQAAVVKVSWVRSAASVSRECTVLDYMETHHITGVERCRGQVPYPLDNRRLMIAMEPVMDGDSVASISEIDERLRPKAVQCIIRTLVQMLSSGVVTTDVQPLISKATGEVLFIDMTEAKIVFTSGDVIPFVDLALAQSFVSEMIGLIPTDSPDELIRVANLQLIQELQNIHEPSGADKMTNLQQQQRQLLELLPAAL